MTTPSPIEAQEPIAWAIKDGRAEEFITRFEDDMKMFEGKDGCVIQPLYAAPSVSQESQPTVGCATDFFAENAKNSPTPADPGPMREAVARIIWDSFCARMGGPFDPAGGSMANDHCVATADHILTLVGGDPVKEAGPLIQGILDDTRAQTAVRRLVWVARTSGGVAGRDEALCAALDEVEAILGGDHGLVGSRPEGRTPSRVSDSDRDLDARRYQRLRILGCAVMDTPQLKEGTVVRFTGLDAILDADLKAVPSRGEFVPPPPSTEEGK